MSGVQFTTGGTLPGGEQFQVHDTSVNNPRRVLVTRLNAAWRSSGTLAGWRFNASGVVVKRDGTPGTAIASLPFLDATSIPEALVAQFVAERDDALRAAVAMTLGQGPVVTATMTKTDAHGKIGG